MLRICLEAQMSNQLSKLIDKEKILQVFKGSS